MVGLNSRVSPGWAILISALVTLVVIIALTLFVSPCGVVRARDHDMHLKYGSTEKFCSQCGGDKPRQDCPSLGSYEFQPCKCFGAQGGALNPPRPLDSPICSLSDSMSQEDMVKTQIGCLRNTFSFPCNTIAGVS